MKAQVILNEQHLLLAEQKKLLNDKFGSEWEIYPVPAEGWNRKETKNISDSFLSKNIDIIFASPVPLLLALTVIMVGYRENSGNSCSAVYLFFNANREKKELPGGKIIFTVPATGWELIRI